MFFLPFPTTFLHKISLVFLILTWDILEGELSNLSEVTVDYFPGKEKTWQISTYFEIFAIEVNDQYIMWFHLINIGKQ